MQLLFLGTAAGTPTRQRNVSALGLSFENSGEWWLFDCGEGTQHQILRTSLSLPRLSRVFLSHLHGDHCFGLPGLLCSRSMQGATRDLNVYGPPGVRQLVDAVRALGETSFGYALRVHEVESGNVIVDDDRHAVQTVGVPHVGESLAYVVNEKLLPGRFRAEQAERLGIPPGPLYGRLKLGETVHLEDGRTVNGAELVDPQIPGRKIVIVSDTHDASNVVEAARGAQLLVHEATYLERDAGDTARERGHSTAAGAGRVAREAGVERLVLTHFSPRYEDGVGDLVVEAEAEFEEGEVIAAEDFLEVEVARRARS